MSFKSFYGIKCTYLVIPDVLLTAYLCYGSLLNIYYPQSYEHLHISQLKKKYFRCESTKFQNKCVKSMSDLIVLIPHELLSAQRSSTPFIKHPRTKLLQSACTCAVSRALLICAGRGRFPCASDLSGGRYAPPRMVIGPPTLPLTGNIFVLKSTLIYGT